MKTIKFNSNELEFLRNHYEMELADAENYVLEIKNLLKKFTTDEKPVTVEKSPKKSSGKRGRPKKEEKQSEVLPVAAPAEKEKKTPAKAKAKGGKSKEKKAGKAAQVETAPPAE